MRSAGPDVHSFDAISRHFQQREMLRGSIPAFKGDPNLYWSWSTNVKTFIAEMQFNPTQTLQLMINHSEGRVKEFLDGMLLDLGTPTVEDIQTIWDELEERHGSTHLIAALLRKRISEFPRFEDPNDGESLLKLHDLCHTVDVNMKRCP